jgi:hypothetical protein
VLLFVSGFARAFYEPALFAVYTGSVPRSEYAGAASWTNLSWQLASVTGPLAAGFGYALAGRVIRLGRARRMGCGKVYLRVCVLCFGQNRCSLP